MSDSCWLWVKHSFCQWKCISGQLTGSSLLRPCSSELFKGRWRWYYGSNYQNTWKRKGQTKWEDKPKEHSLFHIGFSIRNPPQLLLLQYLDSPATKCLWVQHLFYFAIRSLPQQIPHQVLSYQLCPLPPWLVDHLCRVNAVDEGIHLHQFIFI